jgi:hypothetical protein
MFQSDENELCYWQTMMLQKNENEYCLIALPDHLTHEYALLDCWYGRDSRPVHLCCECD